MSYKPFPKSVLSVVLLALAAMNTFGQELPRDRRANATAQLTEPRAADVTVDQSTQTDERARSTSTPREPVTQVNESEMTVSDALQPEPTPAAPAAQARRRIVDQRQIDTRGSLPARIVGAPFRFLAPHVNSGLTRLENDQVLDRLALNLSNPFFHPTFGGLGEGSGFGAGVYVSTADRLSENFKLFFSGHGTLNAYAETLVGAELTPRRFAGGRLNFELVGRYRLRPKEDFWGAGYNSSRDNRTNYNLNERGVRAQTNLRVARTLRVATFMDYSSNTVTAGKDKRFPTTEERFGASGLPGLQRGAALLGTGVFAEFDNRDLAANPHRGLYAHFAATSNDSVGRDDFGFINYSLDARGYLPLGTGRRLLALRLLGDFNEPKGGSQIPFFRLARLGDSETLRGYDTYRFHGRHALHLSVEYRFKLASAFDEKGLGGIEAVAFTDMGQVFNHRREFSRENLRATWGGGLQLSSGRGTLFRLLYGRSPEGSRLMFGFGPSF